jgi:DNA-binding SARP family transcriptional activator/tetratricopeptide (TPR) repeat protein
MALIRLLGPVEVQADGQVLELGPPKRRAVLAALAVDAGRPLPADKLTDRIWGEAAPPQAHNVLYGHIARLRRVLSEAARASGIALRLDRRAGGYLLDVDPDQIDLHLFRGLTERAREHGRDDRTRAGLLRRALKLWRGNPLSDIRGDWVDRVRDTCGRQRLDALVDWAAAELRLGNHDVVIQRVHPELDDYPLVEPLAAVVVRALHAAGRGAEALERYEVVRRRLADELGADPGPELQELHRALLNGPADRSAASVPSPATPTPTPSQLLPDLAGFVGRHSELATLDGVAAPGDRRTAVALIVISGVAGAGKTTLATRWAHRVSGRFPDGQLYVDLRGYGPDDTRAVDPDTAVTGFLEALAVPAHRIPTSTQARAALYRTMLAGRRMLVVLDNARDSEQVRPLLPNSPSCVVVVTSRRQLPDLVAGAGAHPLTPGLLGRAEARDLLVQRLGPGRLAAEPAATDEIITRCGGLPLALAIVAARAAMNPGFALTALANQLRSGWDCLDGFDGTEPRTDLRNVFSWSYARLDAEARRSFRLLALHPGPDLTVPAAASLLGRPSRTVGRTLVKLSHAHLVAEHTPGRYSMHDLLRAYATERAAGEDGGADLGTAVHRMLDHYTRVACLTSEVLDPQRDRVTLPPQPAGVTLPVLDGFDAALNWFRQEYAVLLALVRHAPAGLEPYTWRLAWALATFLNGQGRWDVQLEVQHLALDAAQRAGDPLGQAFSQRFLGRAETRLGRYDLGHLHLRRALELFGQAGDPIGQARTHHDLSYTCERLRRHRDALVHAEQALCLYRRQKHLPGQAVELNAIGWYHAQLGDHRQAVAFCQQALALHRELGSRQAQAAALDSLGYAHHHLGDHAEAIRCYRGAVDLFRQFQERYNEADVLTHLGDCHRDAGDPGAARTAWESALDILAELDHDDAGNLRARLRQLTH